jgi:hypothetical protein
MRSRTGRHHGGRPFPRLAVPTSSSMVNGNDRDQVKGLLVSSDIMSLGGKKLYATWL